MRCAEPGALEPISRQSCVKNGCTAPRPRQRGVPGTAGEPYNRVMSIQVKRAVVGRPLKSTSLGDTLLPRWLALPVFCSDPLSSVAYATEQILLVLGLGGLGLPYLTPWLGLAGGGPFGVVGAPHPPTRPAHPHGGGAGAGSPGKPRG